MILPRNQAAKPADSPQLPLTAKAEFAATSQKTFNQGDPAGAIAFESLFQASSDARAQGEIARGTSKPAAGRFLQGRPISALDPRPSRQ